MVQHRWVTDGRLFAREEGPAATIKVVDGVVAVPPNAFKAYYVFKLDQSFISLTLGIVETSVSYEQQPGILDDAWDWFSKYLIGSHPPETFCICCYCGLLLTRQRSSGGGRAKIGEHLVPRYRGGNNSLANRKPCCYRCNSERGHMPLKVWLYQLELELALVEAGSKRAELTRTRMSNVVKWITYIEQHFEQLFSDGQPRDKSRFII